MREILFSMSRVVFMCGPSGSGKSTFARRLEEHGMVRLSFDAQMWRRGISTVPLPPEVRAEIEADLRAVLLEHMAAGRDVVLDFSFWSRRMRDDYRRLLGPTGVVPETVYLATDPRRGTAHGGQDLTGGAPGPARAAVRVSGRCARSRRRS